ncbi:MAG TPA: hypothetical protein VMR73_00235 [Candidatus Paceibacterota bacterium]|nr:hypothetical protein [Candidatus Paceibacterota bacterium]
MNTNDREYRNLKISGICSIVQIIGFIVVLVKLRWQVGNAGLFVIGLSGLAAVVRHPFLPAYRRHDPLFVIAAASGLGLLFASVVAYF